MRGAPAVSTRSRRRRSLTRRSRGCATRPSSTSKATRCALGIITMNAEQMKLVEDLLDKARRAHPEIEAHFDAETLLEPVCVRNLETAQGDERDLILLGIGFGPTEPGGKTMSMAFGKLNRDGGWRRLNVAVTRARREMKVFTSFDPGMIDLTRTSQQAIADLKHFIEFADRGPRAIAEAVKGSMGGADSPFEEAVALELRRRGWTVVPQVGVSKFRIDLGIVHPDHPGDYLLGVECDGATYHSAATARDRDKIRAAILESLGWKLLRVWSTDWWIDKQRAANGLHALIEECLAQRRRSAEERAAAASVSPPIVRPVADPIEADQAEEPPAPTLCGCSGEDGRRAARPCICAGAGARSRNDGCADWRRRLSRIRPDVVCACYRPRAIL